MSVMQIILGSTCALVTRGRGRDRVVYYRKERGDARLRRSRRFRRLRRNWLRILSLTGENPLMRWFIEHEDGTIEGFDTLRWMEFQESHPGYEDAHRQVALDTVEPFEVSTVCLFMDHSFGGLLGKEGPIFYETMIFGPGSDKADLYQERFRTRKEALAGHAAGVAKAMEWVARAGELVAARAEVAPS
jgi:hypothetical protein